MTNRLAILENSLAKKNAKFDSKLQSHMDCVRSANGQPLNDKRNGASTLGKWEKQNDALRSLKDSIARTEAAINREKSKIAHADSFDVPECLRGFVRDGVISQWRKHPQFFFVAGVEKARIVVSDDGMIACCYVKEIPSQDQYAIFRDVYNAARKIQESRRVA